MKTRTLILVFLLMTVLIAGSCAKEKPDYISKEYELYGTWINSEYSNSPTWHPKIVFNPNGITDHYISITATKPTPLHGQFFITNKWSDSKGNIWYTFIYQISVGKVYMLVKISNSGKTLEWVYSNDYPKEIDPKSSDYRLYNRQ